MIILHIGLPKTASSKLLDYIDKYTDISSIKGRTSELSMSEALNFNYNSLSHNNNYFIKSPDFLTNKELPKLIERINQSGHQIKLILGVRDIVNMSYSLYNHWHKRNELPIGNKCPLDTYNFFLSPFFLNINTHISFLKKYDTIIYNIDNYKGTWQSFFSDLFKLLEIKVDIKNLVDEKIDITTYMDIDNFLIS